MKVSLGGAVSVTATERWLSEIRAARAFADGSTVAAGGAGTFAESQLFNPAASGVIVIVHAILVSVQAAGSIELRTHNVALAVNNGPGVNLLSGGAAGVAGPRQAAPVAIDGTILIPGIRISADTPFLLLRDWWMELGAGEGLLVANSTANAALQVWWEWIEV